MYKICQWLKRCMVLLARNANRRPVADDGFVVVIGRSLGARNGLAGAISVGGESRGRTAAGVANDALLWLDGITDEIGREMRVGLGGGGTAALGCGRGGIAGPIVAIIGRGGGRRGGVHDVAGSVACSLPVALAGGREGRTEILGILARADAAHALGSAVTALVGGEVDDTGESYEMVGPILVDEAKLPHARAKGDAIGFDVHIVVLGSPGLALLPGLGL